MEVYIKDWFMSKIDFPTYAIRTTKAEVVKETGKAFLLRFETETLDGENDVTFERWCPKSCTTSEEEHEAECQEFFKKMNDGLNYNQQLVEYAKNNGIKGIRIGMKTSTLINKIQNSGLAVPQR